MVFRSLTLGGVLCLAASGFFTQAAEAAMFQASTLAAPAVWMPSNHLQLLDFGGVAAAEHFASSVAKSDETAPSVPLSPVLWLFAPLAATLMTWSNRSQRSLR